MQITHTFDSKVKVALTLKYKVNMEIVNEQDRCLPGVCESLLHLK